MNAPPILPAARRAAAALAIALLPLLVHAAVPNDAAVDPYAEELTVLQTEHQRPEPGLLDAASGRQHFDRHFIVPPGLMPEQDVVLQRGGNTWRVWRNGPIAAVTGGLIVLALIAIGVWWRAVGPWTTDEPPTGRQVLRFTAWERGIHWATAISFVLLALTGLLILFGKKLVLPWLGHDAFAIVALASKWTHNVAAPVFVVCSVLLFATFVDRNHFRRWDWRWLRHGGGMATHQHLPADYFNAGEKLWFWIGVTLLGLVMALSGFMMLFPYFANPGGMPAGFTRYLLQIANVTHLAGAAFYVALSLGHIYLGTIGTPGAYTAMRRGPVDESWAHAHHSIWYERLLARREATPPVR